MAAKNNRQYSDVVIVGGGASGLAAAIEIGINDPGLSVTVLEKNPQPARKIRATGSGRCNITNTAAYGFDEIMRFFRRIGIVTRIYENGLVYPYSEAAADVADLLIRRAYELGAEIITDAEVRSVRTVSGSDTGSGMNRRGVSRFETEYSDKIIESAYVVLACGGKAGPMFGTTGDGYRLARELGHSVVTPVPVLTSVECGEWAPEQKPCALSLGGTRTRGRVSLYKHTSGSVTRGEKVFEETGEIQFTRYGLSGICVFNMSRHMRYDRNRGESLANFLIEADLYPDGDIEEVIRTRRDNAFPGEKASDILRTVLKDNIASYVLRSAAELDIDSADKYVCDLTDGDIESIRSAVHGLMFHPVRIRGWKEAQATSGGVSTEETDPETCESRIIDGLYITGELADRDFPCGGFNLSNAWLTGIAAARAITADTGL